MKGKPMNRCDTADELKVSADDSKEVAYALERLKKAGVEPFEGNMNGKVETVFARVVKQATKGKKSLYAKFSDPLFHGVFVIHPDPNAVFFEPFPELFKSYCLRVFKKHSQNQDLLRWDKPIKAQKVEERAVVANSDLESQTERIKAYKELVKIAQAGSFDIYYAGSGLCGACEAQAIDCFAPIKNEKNRQFALNETLCLLTKGSYPITIERLEKECRMIQLVLRAGADPNYRCYYQTPSAVFDSFLDRGNFYGALEIAKSDRFIAPEYPEKTFSILADGVNASECWNNQPGKKKTVCDLNWRTYKDQKALLCTLFDKGIYPQHPLLRQKLQPIYEAEKKARANAPRPAGNVPQGGRVSAER